MTRVALVHDKLTQLGGGERTALRMRSIWPDAPLYTSVYDPVLASELGIENVRTTVLQRIPRIEDRHRWLLPFYDQAFRRLAVDQCDVVVSSSAMFAKSIRPPDDAKHVCYCHTPIRYLWDLRDSHISELPYPAPVRVAVGAMVPYLRRVDLRAARNVDHFVANSRHVAERIERYYGRDSTVIYPPVETEAFAGDFDRGDYLLAAARLFPYKRVDIVVEACERLGLPLKVMGEGSDRPRLEVLAGPATEFLGWVPEQDKAEIFGRARALIVPQIEDFGITTVEALAAGTPVVALAHGGSTEIVDDEVGVSFERQTTDALVDALHELDRRSFDAARLRSSAERFSAGRFDQELRRLVDEIAS